MSRENIEELSNPLLVKNTTSKLHSGGSGSGGSNNNGGASYEEGGESSSSATIMVVVSTLVAVSGSYVFGSAVGYSSPARSGVMNDLGLTVAQYSVFGSILTIGAMIGAVVSGRIADYIGRRGAMAFSEIFCILGWLAIAFSKVAWWAELGRLLVGCGMGLLSYVVPIYIAEITPKDLRGGFTTVHQLMICCGVSLTYLIGAFLNWRALALLGTIPCVIQILGLFFIPESPRWLAKIGKWKECEATLQRLRRENSSTSQEVAEIRAKIGKWKECEATLQRLRRENSSTSQEVAEIRDYTETLKRLSEARILDLFQRRYAYSLAELGLWYYNNSEGSMALPSMQMINEVNLLLMTGFSDSVGTIAMVAVQVPMTAFGVILMDKAGRRPLLLV
ncbi:hypothetical protein C1H46_038025 [Malus baccata]|uniref:Major facilitator superfamily (MFS) profile domain-containing protein n=1 Tax=Malus baccata TaxID=106549 RepID=A0A540KQF7_MALBA|nr:hypothetical protein C1H46_038025 [Malus baccata]